MQDERIYTDAINQNVNFRAHVYKAEGCSWTLYEDPRAQSGRSQVVSPKPDWGRVILPEVGSIWRVDRSVPRRNLVEDDDGFEKKIYPNPPNIQRILDMFDITSLDQIEKVTEVTDLKKIVQIKKLPDEEQFLKTGNGKLGDEKETLRKEEEIEKDLNEAEKKEKKNIENLKKLKKIHEIIKMKEIERIEKIKKKD